MKRFSTHAFLAMTTVAMLANVAIANDVAKLLQDVSVTIRAGGSQGSGVLITRDVVDTDGKTVSMNFVLTAAHVIEDLRSTRTIIGPNGTPKILVEFRDVQILKEDQVNGRKVGEHVMDCKVILYSDATHGHDLALLLVRKPGFTTANATFYNDAVCNVGTELIHVGSLLGQAGSNSMTTGNVSQTGRLLQLGNGAGTLFDQTSCPAFPGSSGGGVFTKDGKYMGMLVRGAGETFNFIVPARRIYNWAERFEVQWLLDPSAKVPSLEEIYDINLENTPSTIRAFTKDAKAYPTLEHKLDSDKATLDFYPNGTK